MHISGELSREEDVLEWLITNKSTGDEEDIIEDVTAKTLNTLIGNVDNLVVLFCKYMNFTKKAIARNLYNRDCKIFKHDPKTDLYLVKKYQSQ